MTPGIRRREETNALIIHTSLTYPDQHVDSKVITGWHVQRGWATCGYHVVIRRDGVAELTGRRLDTVGAHTVGRNHDSVGIVLAGGLVRATADTERRFIEAAEGYKGAAISANYTAPQLVTLREVVRALLTVYPGAEVMGHRDAVADRRPCPCFSVKDWFTRGMVPSVATSLEGD